MSHPTPRQLGTSDLHITPIGLGTWAIGGGDWKFSWGPQDDDVSIATIRAAFDGGINWLDTAPVYGLGHSETVVGRALKEMGTQRPIVATKCGRVWPEGDRSQVNARLTHDSIKHECEQSLTRLGVDVIDLYQIHWPQPDEQIEEGWTAVAELQAEGKIRHAGVSNFSVEQMQRAAAIAPITSLQPQYNLMQRQAEADTLPHCRAHAIGVVGYSTFAKGLLSGKVTPAWVAGLPEDDHRKRDPMYQPESLAALGPAIESFGKLAADKQLAPAQLAAVWSFHQPGLTSAICGARRPDQIQPMAAAMQAQLSPAELQRLDTLFPARGN